MNSTHYIVRIYEGEASLISKWILQYPDAEIGGDLFGHWINEDEIVIEAVVAQNCHTRTPFSLDGQYRSNVEALLTSNHGLENIGSWHSYSLINKPEACDDVETVWRHQPTPGRFLLLIATVDTETGSPKVQMELDVYETTREEYKVVPVINIEILQGQSPIRVNETVNSQMNPSKTSYLELQNQIPDIRSSLIKPEGSRETRVAAPEIVTPEVNVQRNKESDMRASPELKGQESVRGSRKLEDSEVTAEVRAKRTSHPEPSVRSSPSKPKEREASKVRKSKAARAEANAKKYRQPNVRENEGHDDYEDFFPNKASGARGHGKSHDQSVTSETGVRSSSVYDNTFLRTDRSHLRIPKPRHRAKYELSPFTYSYFQRPDGKEGMTLLHYGHSLGSCGECRTMRVRQRENAEIYAETPGKSCNIM